MIESGGEKNGKGGGYVLPCLALVQGEMDYYLPCMALMQGEMDYYLPLVRLLIR